MASKREETVGREVKATTQSGQEKNQHDNSEMNQTTLGGLTTGNFRSIPSINTANKTFEQVLEQNNKRHNRNTIKHKTTTNTRSHTAATGKNTTATGSNTDATGRNTDATGSNTYATGRKLATHTVSTPAGSNVSATTLTTTAPCMDEGSGPHLFERSKLRENEELMDNEFVGFTRPRKGMHAEDDVPLSTPVESTSMMEERRQTDSHEFVGFMRPRMEMTVAVAENDMAGPLSAVESPSAIGEGKEQIGSQDFGFMRPRMGMTIAVENHVPVPPTGRNTDPAKIFVADRAQLDSDTTNINGQLGDIEESSMTDFFEELKSLKSNALKSRATRKPLPDITTFKVPTRKQTTPDTNPRKRKREEEHVQHNVKVIRGENQNLEENHDVPDSTALLDVDVGDEFEAILSLRKKVAQPAFQPPLKKAATTPPASTTKVGTSTALQAPTFRGNRNGKYIPVRPLGNKQKREEEINVIMEDADILESLCATQDETQPPQSTGIMEVSQPAISIEQQRQIDLILHDDDGTWVSIDDATPSTGKQPVNTTLTTPLIESTPSVTQTTSPGITASSSVTPSSSVPLIKQSPLPSPGMPRIFPREKKFALTPTRKFVPPAKRASLMSSTTQPTEVPNSKASVPLVEEPETDSSAVPGEPGTSQFTYAIPKTPTIIRSGDNGLPIQNKFRTPKTNKSAPSLHKPYSQAANVCSDERCLHLTCSRPLFLDREIFLPQGPESFHFPLRPPCLSFHPQFCPRAYHLARPLSNKGLELPQRRPP